MKAYLINGPMAGMTVPISSKSNIRVADDRSTGVRRVNKSELPSSVEYRPADRCEVFGKVIYEVV